MNTSKLILLGGVGRSGTSITSRLLATAENVEFFYEPAIPYYLIDWIDDFEESVWKKLFQCSMYKDLLKNSLAGRNLNLNPYDTSSIFKYKSKETIEERHLKSYSQFELVEKSKDSILVIKILDNIRNHEKLLPLVPNLFSVIVVRNPEDTINSILEKGWFSDYQVSINSPEPAKECIVHNGFRIPKFINETGDIENWIRMTEYERACFYYLWHLNKFKMLSDSQKIIFISYDRMVLQPENTKQKVFDRLGLKDSEMTNKVLNEISPRKKRNKSAKLNPSSRLHEMEAIFQDFDKIVIN